MSFDSPPANVTFARTGKRLYSFRLVRTIHKWAGISALAWLSVLGVTGIVLDHHEWRWVNQLTVPEEITSSRINRLVRGTIMRHMEVDPDDPRQWIGASERGLWRTRDFGATWADIPFEGLGAPPQVTGILPDDRQGWGRLWLATDEGIWSLAPDEGTARPFALRDVYVSWLNPGPSADELLGVDHKSRVFRVGTDDPDRVNWYDFEGAHIAELKRNVSLFRFIFDIHIGKGLLPQPYGMLVNDYGGIAIAVLSLTGILFWGLPRLWRGRKPKRSLKSRQRLLRWLFRAHGPVIGLLAAVPILYFSVTGLFLNHVTGFNEWGKDVPLARAALPPAYQFVNLEDEIESAVGYPGAPRRLTVSTRLGVLNTEDAGRTWTYESALENAVERVGGEPGVVKLRRRGDHVFALATTNAVRRDGGAWQTIAGPRFALTDVARAGGEWYAKASRGLYKGATPLDLRLTEFQVPPLKGTSAYLFVADIHVGVIFHEQWKWINDFVSVLAIVLVVSGVLTWWRRKWM